MVLSFRSELKATSPFQSETLLNAIRSLTMYYNVLLLVTTLTLGFSCVLLYRVSVLEEDFRGLKGHMSFRLKKPDPEKLSDGILPGIVSTTRPVCERICCGL